MTWGTISHGEFRFDALLLVDRTIYVTSTVRIRHCDIRPLGVRQLDWRSIDRRTAVHVTRPRCAARSTRVVHADVSIARGGLAPRGFPRSSRLAITVRGRWPGARISQPSENSPQPPARCKSSSIRLTPSLFRAAQSEAIMAQCGQMLRKRKS